MSDTEVKPNPAAKHEPTINTSRGAVDGPLVDIMGGFSRHEIRIHEHGFVALIDAMPRLCPQGQTADFAIVQAARVSYGQGTKKVNEDRGLIRYLLRHRHTTPFEMVEFKFHIAMPIFIARQWIRHRTANVNEYSGRYSIVPDQFYRPTVEQVRKQSKGNRQGGEETFVGSETARQRDSETGKQRGSETARQRDSETAKQRDSETAKQRDSETAKQRDSETAKQRDSETAKQRDSETGKAGDGLQTAEEFVKYLEEAEALYTKYTKLTEAGVSRELARIGLPVSVYTQWYWKCDLHNILRFLSLRMDAHAQKEIREYADAMYALLEPIVPVTMEAWRDYELESVRLTRLEVEALRGMREGGDGSIKTDNSREKIEWQAKRESLGL